MRFDLNDYFYSKHKFQVLVGVIMLSSISVKTMRAE